MGNHYANLSSSYAHVAAHNAPVLAWAILRVPNIAMKGPNFGPKAPYSLAWSSKTCHTGRSQRLSVVSKHLPYWTVAFATTAPLPAYPPAQSVCTFRNTTPSSKKADSPNHTWRMHQQYIEHDRTTKPPHAEPCHQHASREHPLPLPACRLVIPETRRMQSPMAP